jgi:hypothetical protein
MPEAAPTITDPTLAGLVVPEPTPAPAAPPAPAPTPNPVLATDLPPDKLKDRLEQAARKREADLLAKFGGAKPEDIEAKLKRLQELEDASLSEKERTEKQIAELRVQAAEAERYKKLFGEQTAAELTGLSEEQRAAVLAFAGEDPVEQHRMVQAFRMAGAVKGNGAEVAPPTPAPKATTVPAGAAPSPATGPKSKREEWVELQGRDPIAAQFFYQLHALEIGE